MVFEAVVAGIGGGDEGVVGQADFGGALDVGDVDFEGVAEPEDFGAGEHLGSFDECPVGIRCQAVVGEALAKGVAVFVFDEVVGKFIEREFEGFGGCSGAVEDGGVVAGEEDGALVIATDGGVNVEIFLDFPGEGSAGESLVEQIGEGLEGVYSVLVGDWSVGEEILAGGFGEVIEAVLGSGAEALEIEAAGG